MKYFSCLAFSFLTVFLAVVGAQAAELTADDLRCEIIVEDKVLETKQGAISADPEYSYVALSSEGSKESDNYGYSFMFDKKTQTARLSSNSATIEVAMPVGKVVSWEIFDNWGGPDTNVTCRRGGVPTVALKPASSYSCVGRSLEVPYDIGAAPQINVYKAFTVKSDQYGVGFRDADRDRGAPDLNFELESSGEAWLLLGDISSHVLDSFRTRMLAGETTKIRMGGELSHSDIVCQAK